MKIQTSALRVALATAAVLVVLLVAGVALRAGSPRPPQAAAITTQAAGMTAPTTAPALRTVVVANPLNQSGVPAQSVVQQANEPPARDTRDGTARQTNDDGGSLRHAEDNDD